MKKLGSKIFSLVVIGFLIFFLVLKDNYNEIIEALRESNIRYIIFGFLVILIGDLFKSIAITEVIQEEKKDYKYKNGFLFILQTNFFNGITPFSLGGQPFQLYTLKKYEKINYGNGIKILFKDFYSYQIALIIISTICLILNNVLNIVVFNSAIKLLIIIGYLLNLFIALILIFLPYSKENFNFVNKIITNILFKIRLVKDKDEVISNFNKSILEFKDNIKNTLKNKSIVIRCILLNIIKIVSIGICTFICFKSIYVHIPLLESVIFTIITITMASFIPIPGSSGGMEYGFITLFASFAIDAKISAVMIIWRFITYYVPLIVGGILFSLKNRE